MSKKMNMAGAQFGRLTVIRESETPGKWVCRCDCGRETVVFGGNLRKGLTSSCGCYNREQSSKRALVHGGTSGGKTRLFNTWVSMRNRCNNPNDSYYKDYGGRGITVCDEWQSDFAAFREWALANGYKSNLSIDRIDNNKGYFPKNCRWATAKEQARNRRSNRNITAFGKTQTIQAWAEETGLKYRTLHHRIEAGWPIEKALTTYV